MLPMELDQEQRWVEKKTASGSTWAAQLEDLANVYFNNLTTTQKRNSRIRRSNGHIFELSNASGGYFARSADHYTDDVADGIDITTLNLDKKVAISANLRASGVTIVPAGNISNTLILEVFE